MVGTAAAGSAAPYLRTFLMERNYFSRLLRRGRKLFRTSQRRGRILTPSALALEALEDRRLLAASLGSSLLVERLVPATSPISIQQPAVVQQPTLSITFIQTSGAGLF